MPQPKVLPIQPLRQLLQQPLLTAALALVLLAPGVAEAARYLYRFANADGGLEIAHAIPSDRVALGYEILDSRSGRVVEIVEPQKTQAEVDRINRETQARNACRDALARVNSLYQSENDVAAAEAQAIRSLEGRIEDATANLRRALDRKRDYEAAAAQMERSGKSLDRTLLSNIESAEAQVGNLQEEIKMRRVEQETAHVRFARDLALFQQASCANEAALGFLKGNVANVEDDSAATDG